MWNKLKLGIGIIIRGIGDIPSHVVWLAVAFVVIMVVGQTYEVLMRYVFSRPTGFMDEVVSLLLVGIITAGIAWTLKNGGHISVTMATDYLPLRVQQWLKLVTSVISLVFCVFVAYYIYIKVLDEYTHNVKTMSSLSTPLYIPEAALCVGFTLLAWELVRDIYRTGKTLYLSHPKSGSNDQSLMNKSKER